MLVLKESLGCQIQSDHACQSFVFKGEDKWMNGIHLITILATIALKRLVTGDR